MSKNEKINRYVSTSSHGGMTTVICPSGDYSETYVRSEDYDTLRRQLAEAEADSDSWCDQASQRVEDWDEMRQRAEAAEAKLALAEQDARRYRRVRECADGFEVISDHFGSGPERIYGMDLDVALDDVMAAAIAAGEGKDD